MKVGVPALYIIYVRNGPSVGYNASSWPFEYAIIWPTEVGSAIVSGKSAMFA
jgi:hypothetical protein